MDIDTIRKNRISIKIAIWIKEYTHALRVLAGVFFGLALLTGLIWIFGKNLEPIAYVFGLISSLLFASPSIAKYILPDRKPVKHMHYDEILDFTKTTNAATQGK